MLKINNLNFGYHKEYATIFNLNLNVLKNEKVILLGSDIEGKESLLRIIAGQESFKSGEVLLRDIPIKKVDFKNEISLGYLSYKTTFFENKTVYENLEYVCKIRKEDKKLTSDKINNVIKKLGLSDIKYKKLKTLSNYNKLLVAVGRLMLRDTDLLLIDDIFTVLNEKEQLLILPIIKELANRSGAVIISISSDELVNEFLFKQVNFNYGTIE